MLRISNVQPCSTTARLTCLWYDAILSPSSFIGLTASFTYTAKSIVPPDNFSLEKIIVLV